ncbi:ATP-binding protein [Maridesulfovibrio sp.]|uniref:ATP-binding protein n=2 Tax=Maridesulfovibrio TaxID=2794998 RepID=UPI003B00FF6D
MQLRRNRVHPGLSVFFCLIMILFLLFGCVPEKESPKVVDGVVDLSSWDFERDGPVRLFGNWEFRWGDSAGGDRFHVPGLWQGQTAAGKVLSPQGNALYSLGLIMPEGIPERMAVLVAGGMSVCEIRINGETIESSGIVGISAGSEKPGRHYVIAECPNSAQLSRLTLLVSNYHNVQGGLNGDVLLGTSRQINDFYTIPRLLGACMAGALFCLALMYAALFFMRRSSGEYFYFGLFCLFWCAAILFSPSSGFLMTVLAPSIPWKYYISFSMLPYGATVPLMLMFYHRLFPKRFAKVVERVCWAVGLLYVGYILLTPPNAYDVVLFFYYMFSNLVLIYMFACFALDLFNREKGIWVLFLGYAALGFAELDEMLFDLNIINSASLRPLGVFIFILSYACYLALRFSRAFAKVEKLSVELESANVRLLQLDKLKDDFLAKTTHELKTPLAGMIGVAESLLGGTGGSLSGTTSGHLKVIVHSGKRLANLINDVLDLSRLKHRDIVLQQEPVSPYAAARRVLALGETLKRGENVSLINSIKPDFPAVKADPDRIEQILFNLIGNSLKFTQSGHVTVSAEERGGMVEISVTDTGPGISAEDRKVIFDTYEQGSSPESGGMGLGLSITRHLVELHGGTLTVTSEQGSGSCFSFSLPLAEKSIFEAPAGPMNEAVSPAFVTAESLQSHVPISGNKYQVLVVDDEPVNLQVVASILNLAGISFRTAQDGNTALQMLAGGHEPDMLLLDVMMPDISGYSLCRELRRKYPASVLPVVLLTVKNRIEDIVEGFAAGANDYLTKPFSREELGARVAMQLKLKEAYIALEENLELKRELELRRRTESGLRYMQARLSGILDSIDEAIIGVNLSNEIAFCNRPFEEICGRSGRELLGQPLASLFVDTENSKSADLLDYVRQQAGVAEQPLIFDGLFITGGAGKNRDVSFWVTDMEIEEETLALMIVRPARTAGLAGSASISSRLFQELSANRQRILRLEETVLSLESGDPQDRQAVLENLKSLDELLEGLGSQLLPAKNGDKRALAVKVMNLAVDCWMESTGTAKADMAEQSGLWNVYMEKDGYFRTQTLDKYLEEKTLPKNPRWKKILVTADFVLANCTADSAIRRQLKEGAELLKS